MPDATKRPLSEWRETEWLQYLQRQAQRLTACPQSADDLAHTCLIAFYDHHRRYPWQHPEPAHALRWCYQKLRALACDAHRYAQRHPCLAPETLPEGVACVDIAPQVQGDIDGERFLASLLPCLRAAVELRLAGYSWEQAAQQLGVKASTLRGYLPDLRAKFVEFFGYDPSKRASESLIDTEGQNSLSEETGGYGYAGDNHEELILETIMTSSFTWETQVTGSFTVSPESMGLEFGTEVSYSTSESYSCGMETGVTMTLRPGELGIFLVRPVGYREEWLCDVYDKQGFVGETTVCHSAPPPSAAPPFVHMVFSRMNSSLEAFTQEMAARRANLWCATQMTYPIPCGR